MADRRVLRDSPWIQRRLARLTSTNTFYAEYCLDRRGIGHHTGKPLTWGIQPNEEQLKSIDVFVLEDVRVAASTVMEWGSGTFLVFVEEDGSLLVDEVYQVTPEYPVSA